MSVVTESYPMQVRATPLHTVLIAEDDADDRLLAEEAFRVSQVECNLQFVGDGEQLLAYLRGERQYADRALYPFPRVVLLDLNMPRKDGREALAEMRADPLLRDLPVMVLTTSRAHEDRARVIHLKACDFATKPTRFDELVGVVRRLSQWLGPLPARERE
jgi:two-component system response regulator